MPSIDNVNVELSVLLGSTVMPIHQLLRMGRGAVIGLDAAEESSVTLLANDHPIARGVVFVNGERIGVEITEMLFGRESNSPESPAAEAA